MLQNYTLRSLCLKPFQTQLIFLQICKPYSSRSSNGDDEKDLNAARQWFAKFNKNSIPASISSTTYVAASGSGGQKTNKTSSKANTIWKMSALEHHIPKILVSELRSSRYYVKSSDSIQIQCDAHRNRTQNMDETHVRFNNEIKKLYDQKVPGITSAEQQAKVVKLIKSENTLRLKIKKQHGDKKRARSGGGRENF